MIRPAQEVGVADLARDDRRNAQCLPCTPVFRPRFHEGIRTGSIDVGERAEQQQMAHAFRVCGGIDGDSRSALRNASQRDPVGTDRVEHRREIAEAVIERRHARVAIRQPLAALVVRNEPRERRKPSHPGTVLCILPSHLDVRNDPRKANERHIAVTDDLIGDMHIAVARVARLRHRHERVRRRSHLPRLQRISATRPSRTASNAVSRALRARNERNRSSNGPPRRDPLGDKQPRRSTARRFPSGARQRHGQSTRCWLGRALTRAPATARHCRSPMI